MSSYVITYHHISSSIIIYLVSNRVIRCIYCIRLYTYIYIWLGGFGSGMLGGAVRTSHPSHPAENDGFFLGYCNYPQMTLFISGE